MAGSRVWLGAGSVLATVCLLSSMTGCGVAASVGPPPVMVPRDQQDLVGTWHDARGNPLPDGRNASNGILVIQAGPGSTSCSTKNVTVFMELSWPPGRRLDWNQGYDPADTNRFVRDTEGSLMATDGASDLDTSLPASAENTGINKDGNSIYADVTEPDAIWVRRGSGKVERWARLGAGEGCA